MSRRLGSWFMDESTEDQQADPISEIFSSLFDSLAKALDGQKMVIAHIAGYRAALEEAGFSSDAAEEMTVDYHAWL